MQARSLWRHPASWVLALAAVVAVGVASIPSAEGGDDADDGVPSGTVAFFGAGAACPLGWEDATSLQGRLPVGVVSPSAVGRSVGTPLTDREDRAHSHPYSGEVRLPVRNIAAVDGSNRQGAQSGAHTVSGTTGAGRTGLPFVQLRPCVKR